MATITPDLMTEGMNLMFIGMGTVFAFLTLLVFMTKTMSSLVNKFAAEEPAMAASTVPVAITAAVDNETLQVIQEAIRQHRARQK